MAQQRSVLTIGKATQDVFLRDDEFDPKLEGKVAYTHLPLGAKLNIAEAYFTTGGNATNVAVTLARQGLEAYYSWLLGNDPASQASVAALDEDNVNLRYVQHISGLMSSYSTVLLSPDGERTILNYSGTLPASRQIERLLDSMNGTHPSWVYPSAVGGIENLGLIVSWARQRLARVMLNPAGSELEDPIKLKSLLSDVEVLCLNKEEMKLLVEGDSLEELVIHGLGYCSVVIVSDGPNGVCASDGKTIVTAGMYEDVPVIDRTGAGDAFAGGFLSQWVLGRSLKDSIILASANSTSVVGSIGAKAGILHAGAALHEMKITEKDLEETK